MILNTGSRTDIPAYFSEWFYRRIREGYVCTRNPYFPAQVTRYRLDPEIVDCLVFCTKNPQPMFFRLSELDAYGQYWFVTITPYGRDIEPHVPDRGQVMEYFRELSRYVGTGRICWRYDPVFLSEKYSLSFHLKTFEQMASGLSGYTNTCVISFIDLYEKTLRNFKGVTRVGEQERFQITEGFVKIGSAYGIRIKTCAEGNALAQCGADVNGCLTQSVLEEALEEELWIPKKGKARKECACLLSNDIGMYHTCGHGCLYCYANYDRKTVEENLKKHDPSSPFLIGTSRPEDLVREAEQKSFKTGQRKLPF